MYGERGDKATKLITWCADAEHMCLDQQKNEDSHGMHYWTRNNKEMHIFKTHEELPLRSWGINPKGKQRTHAVETRINTVQK